MSLVTRTTEVGREFAMVLPRTVSGLRESTGWNPVSPRGARQFGEVMLDELVLCGFSLLGGDLTERGAAAVGVRAGRRRIVGAGHRRCACRPETVAHNIDTAAPDRRAGLRASDVRARSGAAEDAGGRRPGRTGASGGARVPAHRRPAAVAGLGARRRPGRHRGSGAVPDRPDTPQAGLQRRDAGAAGPWLPAPGMAGLPGHGSAGQRRGHDALGVRGARGGALGAAAGHRRCGVGDFDGDPGGRVGFAPGARHRRGGPLYADPGAQWDDRAAPQSLWAG